MSPHAIDITALKQAASLAVERKRLLGILGEQACGLHCVGPFLDEGAVAAVLPAYRKWLTDQVGSLSERLIGMGLVVTDPDFPADDVAHDTVTFTDVHGTTRYVRPALRG